jgi:hypothetical protein
VASELAMKNLEYRRLKVQLAYLYFHRGSVTESCMEALIAAALNGIKKKMFAHHRNVGLVWNSKGCKAWNGIRQPGGKVVPISGCLKLK